MFDADEHTRRETTLAVGQKVYRAKWDKVECGEVIRIGRASFFGGSLSPQENPDGDYPFIVAMFRHDYESQTYEWRFFADETKARNKLVAELRDRAKSLRRDAGQWDQLAAKLEADQPAAAEADQATAG